MRKFLISAALVSTALTVAPALAQDYGHRGYDQRGDRRGDWNRGPDRPAVNNLLRQLDQVDFRIQRSLQRRTISFREAASLRREANDIRIRVNVRGRDGLNGREFAQLQVRVNQLEQRVTMERRDNDRRPY